MSNNKSTDDNDLDDILLGNTTSVDNPVENISNSSIGTDSPVSLDTIDETTEIDTDSEEKVDEVLSSDKTFENDSMAPTSDPDTPEGQSPTDSVESPTRGGSVHSEGYSGYLGDDEEFLAGDDEVVHEEMNMAIVKQSGAVVAWQVDNFYKDNGNLRKPIHLRNDPPIFTVTDSDDKSVTFVVTREFAGQLESIMGDIYRGYFGISSKRAKDVKGSAWENVKTWVTKNKAKSIVLGILSLTVLVFAFAL